VPSPWKLEPADEAAAAALGFSNHRLAQIRTEEAANRDEARLFCPCASCQATGAGRCVGQFDGYRRVQGMLVYLTRWMVVLTSSCSLEALAGGATTVVLRDVTYQDRSSDPPYLLDSLSYC